MSARLPISSAASTRLKDRAWQGVVLKTTVEQTLMRGLATAGPCSVSGLPQSRSGTSVTGPIVDHEGSPPCAAPGHALSCSGVGSTFSSLVVLVDDRLRRPPWAGLGT